MVKSHGLFNDKYTFLRYRKQWKAGTVTSERQIAANQRNAHRGRPGRGRPCELIGDLQAFREVRCVTRFIHRSLGVSQVLVHKLIV